MSENAMDEGQRLISASIGMSVTTGSITQIAKGSQGVWTTAIAAAVFVT